MTSVVETNPDIIEYNLLLLPKIYRDRIDYDITSGCWNWTGTLNLGGYAQLTIKSKTYIVHRLIYQKIYGQLPKDRVLDHLCRNRRCVNYLHLDPVTSKINNLRGIGIASRNANKSVCMRGHTFMTISRTNGSTRRVCLTCKNASIKRSKQKDKLEKLSRILKKEFNYQ